MMQLALWVLFAACSKDNGDSAGEADTDTDSDTDADSDGDCEFTACASDPTGSWTIDAICFDFSALKGSCPTATIDASADPEGTLDLLESKVYTLSVTYDITIVETLPKECLGGVGDCATFGAAMSADCTGDASIACECTLYDSQKAQGDGTWSYAGSTITIVGSDAKDVEVTGDFCADSSSMKLQTTGTKVPAVFTLSR